MGSGRSTRGRKRDTPKYRPYIGTDAGAEARMKQVMEKTKTKKPKRHMTHNPHTSRHNPTIRTLSLGEFPPPGKVIFAYAPRKSGCNPVREIERRPKKEDAHESETHHTIIPGEHTTGAHDEGKKAGRPTQRTKRRSKRCRSAQ